MCASVTELYRVRKAVNGDRDITFAGKTVRVVGPSSRRIGEVDVTLVGDPSGQRYHYFPSELEELSPSCAGCAMLHDEARKLRERVGLLEARLRQIALEARELTEHARHVGE